MGACNPGVGGSNHALRVELSRLKGREKLKKVPKQTKTVDFGSWLIFNVQNLAPERSERSAHPSKLESYDSIEDPE